MQTSTGDMDVSTDNAGVSTATHNQVKEEVDRLRAQNAAYKARMEAIDAMRLEELVSMKKDVHEFITETVDDELAAPYKRDLQPMCRWVGDMDKANDAMDTNVSIGRLLHCASARYKRTREEASQAAEKASLLATKMQELEAAQNENAKKQQRIDELGQLLQETTETAKRFQQELARYGYVQDKVDFSKQSARENVGESRSEANTPAMNVSASASGAPAVKVNDALLSYVLNGKSSTTNGRILPSATSHQMLGSMQDDSVSNAIARGHM